MSKDEKEICLYCKAWKFVETKHNRVSADFKIGECRFNAPAPMGRWPRTAERDWCLDFIERPDDHESTFEHISEPANRVLSKLTGGEDAA